ncbi:DUF6680 family protein [Alteromonas naphthalenivorans]|uniref:Uncharacterized protein n=1 Tax=Alteromonas naphthalenivorans TaxID=715451 RepID=F5Z890_ALTNA|nr:DUF6680 family protein [Alteromonas naphthalenivorans]AEF03283.1 hypothetical protein ambt_08785 [Alteromonas naphthalenivorans]
MDITITVISSLLSGIIGVGISTWYYRRYESRKQKIELLRKIVGFRFALTEKTSPEAKAQFFSALSEIVILFHDCPAIIQALNNMHRELAVPNRMHDNLVSLFKAICKEMGISHAGLNDDFFLRPFTPIQ